MNENPGWENGGLGVSSDEQVLESITAGPSCNIGKQERAGEARKELTGTVNGVLSELWVRRGGMTTMEGEREAGR